MSWDRHSQRVGLWTLPAKGIRRLPPGGGGTKKLRLPPGMPRLALDGNPIFECEWRRIGHQCGGVKGSQRDDLEPVAQLGLAAANGSQ